jgi:cob(I)alamin adenosyltransferase
MAVNLTRIYTKLGDGGETHLGDMSRVPKTHPRIEAYGVTDELNSLIGVARTIDSMPKAYDAWLKRAQNDLFDVGADLAVPSYEDERLRITPAHTEWLEKVCDEVNAKLPKLNSFLLPGGNAAAAQLHVCRTVCRRAERRALHVDGVNPEIIKYLNRLSDMFFILARGANDGDEPLWEPGASQGDQAN